MEVSNKKNSTDFNIKKANKGEVIPDAKLKKMFRNIMASIRGRPKPVKKEYVELLGKDIKEILNQNLESEILSYFDAIENPSERKTAVLLFDASKKLYSQEKPRNDGLRALDHLCTIAYWAVKGGANFKAVLAAMFHDVKEEEKIKDRTEFSNLVGKGCSQEVINSVWRKISKISNMRPKDEPVYKANNFLNKNLTCAKDLENPKILEALKIVISDYSDYVIKVYHSNDYDVILLKELDALHNIRSAIYLDPKNKEDFAKIIRIFLKLETHVDASKKICYDIARLQLIAAWALLKKLEKSEIDMSSDFFVNLYSIIWSHTYSISQNQYRVEGRGVGSTDPRAKLNIDTLPYRRTVPVIFHPEYRNWSEAIFEEGDESKVEITIPRHCFPNMKIGLLKYAYSELKQTIFRSSPKRRLGKRDFINSKFYELDEQMVTRQIKSRFSRAGIMVVKAESTLWPVFKNDAIVFQIQIPLSLKRKREGLRFALQKKAPYQDILTEKLSEDYARFIRTSERITRKAFASSLKEAIQRSTYEETIDDMNGSSPLP